jgi:hypothetical protein
LGQLLHGIHEAQTALIGHPPDRVTVGRTAKAVVEALVIVDIEAGRLFIMERAAALIFAARLANFDGLADERRQKRPAAEFVEPGWG